MNAATTRLWTLGAVLVMAVIVALGWFLGISPKLADAARFEQERLSVVAQNEVARATIAQLQEDFERLDELQDELDELRAEFPTDAEYDAAVEELLAGLAANELTLENISINEPAPTTALALGDGEEAPAPEVNGDGVLPAGSLLRVPVSVTVNGALPAVLAYIDALQLSPRFAIVSSGTYTAGLDGSDGSMSFSMVVYAITGVELLDVPADADAAPQPEPADPSATPTPSP